jgi:very-short-patch-repair endonuclease
MKSSTVFKKGQIPWNKGIRVQLDINVIKRMYFEEQKSTYDIGKELNVSQKTIENRLKENGLTLRKNSEHTELAKQKISKKVLSNYNNLSEEEKTKVKNRLKKFCRYNQARKGLPAWNRGISPSKESNMRQSHVMKRYYQTHPETIKLIKQARAKQIFPLKDSSIEVKIQDFLKQLGIEFFTHQHVSIEHDYQCDILIPSMNLVIECDGAYWHKYPTRRDIDNIRTKELIEKGFKVLRLWEFEIKDMELNDFKMRLHE